MSFKTGRRQFLQTMTGGAIAMRAFTRQASTGVTTTKLADNFTLLSGAGGNALLVRTPEGLLMVDGGLPERSGALLDAVTQQFGNTPVRLAFNTHWHLEHTGANDRLGRAGTKIVAHENTRLWMTRDILVEWQKNKVYPVRAKE